MKPWTPGREEIDALIAANKLQRVLNADRNTGALMARAHQLLDSAARIADAAGCAYHQWSWFGE